MKYIKNSNDPPKTHYILKNMRINNSRTRSNGLYLIMRTRTRGNFLFADKRADIGRPCGGARASAPRRVRSGRPGCARRRGGGQTTPPQARYWMTRARGHAHREVGAGRSGSASRRAAPASFRRVSGVGGFCKEFFGSFRMRLRSAVF